MTFLAGYPAHLVLEDERGEFEVRGFLTGPADEDGLVVDVHQLTINYDRVLDALDARAKESRGQRRPVY